MITEKDLQEAIAECEGVRNPSYSTCVKLAALYTIRETLFGSPAVTPLTATDGVGISGYSGSCSDRIAYSSESDFGRAVNGMITDSVMKIMDELMEAVSVYNRPLYQATMRRLEE